MTRCQHCKKLTHSEHLDVYYDIIDQDKVIELETMENWTAKYMYMQSDKRIDDPYEYGRLKVGDIYIHFIVKNEHK